MHEILKRWRSFFDKSRIGFDMNKITKSSQAKIERYSAYSNEASAYSWHKEKEARKNYESTHGGRTYIWVQDEFINYASSRWNYISRYETPFNGYFSSCNGYGHKDLNCRNAIRCWNCNKYRHIDQKFGMKKPPKPRFTKVWEEN